MRNELMFSLDKKFQKEIFEAVISKYGGSVKASKILNIPASSIRGYKNIYFKVVPEEVLNKLIKLGFLDKKDLNKNKIEIFDKSEIIKKILNLGREKRKKHFKVLKKKIPSLNEIISNGFIDLEKWFNEYQNLVNSNFRKMNIEKEKGHLILKYNNFTREGYKNFRVELPSKIPLNDELIYFFGLWCGDRAGGKRFGVCNQNSEIINFTEYFLKKYGQKVERILYITKNVSEPKIIFDKKFVIDKEIKGWVLSVHSNNGVFASFFYYLQSHLADFLNLIGNKAAFFAGLFDAEGNVSLYNKSLRWACKKDEFIKIYSNNLKKIDLFDRYDGHCLITYDVKGFYSKIFPYMKHKNKINLIEILHKGEGDLPKGFIDILKIIKIAPNISPKEIAKALKKNKVYSELGLLKKFGFISQNNPHHNYKINEKGIKSLGI